jgi:hypothetical protein
MASNMNIYNIIKEEQSYVGKYVRAQLEFYKRDNSWYEAECFCESFSDYIYTVRTKYNKHYTIPSHQIKHVIPVTTIQQFNIGDVVRAEVYYYQIDGPQYDYCKIVNVNHFANDIDYDLQILSNDKNITVQQSKIKGHVNLQKAKYKIGDYIGVKHIGGSPYDPETIIKNGVITHVKEWYDKVTYSVKYDDATIYSYVYHENIVPPKKPEPIKTPEQIKQEHLEFLVHEEQRLLEQLEHIRRAKMNIQ